MEALFVLIGFGLILWILGAPFYVLVLAQRLKQLDEELRALRRNVNELNRRSAPESAPTPASPTISTPSPSTPTAESVVVAAVDETPPPLPAIVDLTAAVRALPHRAAPPEKPASKETAYVKRLVQEQLDFEYMTASRWLSWIGALAFVLSAGFGFKYAIDHGVITPAVRVAVGIATSLGLFYAAHLAIRRDYRAFGQGLAGVAMGLGYLTWFAAQEWHQLVDLPTAYAGMILTTVIGVTLATVHSSEAIAVLGAIGGCLTPALLWPTQNAFTIVFPYFLVLNAGLAGVSSRMRWLIPTPVVIVGAAFAWLYWRDNQALPPYVLSLVMLGIMLAIHLGLLIWRLCFRQQDWHASEIGIAVALPWLIFLAMGDVASANGHNDKAWLCWSFAVCMFLLAILTPKVFFIQGIAFVTIAIPLTFTGILVPLAWMIEAAVLVELGLRWRRPTLVELALVVLLLPQAYVVTFALSSLENPAEQRASVIDEMFGRPAIEWQSTSTLGSLINPRSVVFLADIVVFFWLAWRLRHWEPGPRLVGSFNPAVAFMVFIPWLWVALLMLESLTFGRTHHWTTTRLVDACVGWMVLTAILSLSVGVYWRQRVLEVNGMLLTSLAVLALVLAMVVDLRFIDPPSQRLWALHWRGLFVVIMMAFLGLISTVFRQRDGIRGGLIGTVGLSRSQQIASAAFVLGVCFLTCETYVFGATHDWRKFTSLAISLAWIVYAVVSLGVGIGLRSAVLRTLALGLLVAVIVKAFGHDLWYLDQLIRVIAFAVLGLALMGSSFLYRRYRDRIRQLLTDEAPTPGAD